MYRAQAVTQRIFKVGWHQDITSAADKPVRAAFEPAMLTKEGRERPGVSHLQQ